MDKFYQEDPPPSGDAFKIYGFFIDVNGRGKRINTDAKRNSKV